MRRWYGVAVGGLGWSPSEFWCATVAEFVMAVDGHNQTQGGGGGVTPLSRAEMEALERKHLKNG